VVSKREVVPQDERASESCQHCECSEYLAALWRKALSNKKTARGDRAVVCQQG
jgi:hypothetical protein